MNTVSQKVASLREMFNGDMRPGVVVETLSHIDQLFPVSRIEKGKKVIPLRLRQKAFPSIQFNDFGRTFDLNDYLAINRVAGLLILKDGEVALENYEFGIGPDTRWASCSIAKSMTSTLAGVAVQDGCIQSLDDPVGKYVPALVGSAYENVSVRNILLMASGVRWDETYIDPSSERRKLLDLQLTLRQPGVTLEYLGTLGRKGEQGTIWNYSTADSYILGAVIEGATKESVSDYFSRKIWSRLGVEQDTSLWLEAPGGLPLVGSGFSATLRDYGRFGQFVLDGGVVDGEQMVPEDWFKEAGRPHVIGEKKADYGYMWWIPPQSDPIQKGAFEAQGIYGQCIYVNPREKLVVVELCARSKPSNTSYLEFDDEAFFIAVAKALR